MAHVVIHPAAEELPDAEGYHVEEACGAVHLPPVLFGHEVSEEGATRAVHEDLEEADQTHC